jgi:hypothetical protein
MKRTDAHPAGVLEIATDESSRKRLQREAKAGRAFRIFPSAYISGATLSPADCVRLHLTEVIAAVWPDAVLCGSTALRNGVVSSGSVYLATGGAYRRNLLHAGDFVLVPVQGPGALPGDFLHGPGVHLAGNARRLVENYPVAGRPPAHSAGRTAVEDAIDAFARRGPEFVAQVRRELDVISAHFDQSAVAGVRALLDAVLGESVRVRPRSALLAARLAGQPFDQRVIRLVDGVLDTLSQHAPVAVTAAAGAARWEWLPFFESYFSNYIEGTTFTVDEARRIIVDGIVPADRPADAHDVSSTYRLVSGPAAGQVPANAREFVETLRDRHAVLMASRLDKHPGEFKRANNQAGGYIFTSWDQVEGTLVRGFQSLESVVDPFARYVAMSVLLTECHPFDDGNGRISRLMANAELSARGYCRIVVPTVYRGNYLSALSAVSTEAGQGQQLLAVLAFAQRWTAQVDWSTCENADRDLTRTHAYKESYVAEGEGVRLTLPSAIPE